MSSAAFRSIWSVNRKVKENILTKGLLGHGGSGADVPACATLVLLVGSACGMGLFVAFRDLAVDPSVLTRKSLRVSDADAYDPRKSMRLERRADRFHDHFIRRWVERKYLTGEQHTLDIDKSAMPASILVWRK